MNEHDSKSTFDAAELQDRLIDAALRETLGGQTPPDLSERILSGARVDAAPLADRGAAVGPTASTRGYSRLMWASIALAASLLIVVGLAVTSVNDGVYSERRVLSRDNAKRLRSSSSVFNELSGSKNLHDRRLSELAEFEQSTELPVISQEASRERSQPEGQTQLLSNRSVSDGLKRSELRIELLKSVATPRLQIEEEARVAPLAAAVAPATAAPASTRHFGIDYDFNIKDQVAPASDDASVASGRVGGADMYARGSLVPSESASLDVGGEASGFGRGPGQGGDQYAKIVENPFKAVSPATTDNRLSTFSIDVDTASYANVRQFLVQSGALPPPDAVRIEELVNYFDYQYSAPTGDVPFAANVEVAACPWNGEHRLARVGIKGREMDRSKRPPSNLVFLIDISGSMDEPAKLPLLLEGMRMLTRELGENDRVAIAVYAGSEGLALESTRGTEQDKILDVLDKLHAGGSTAGGAGIELAYKVATQNFIKGGVNRVILCTDGDFNVGVTSTADLERLAESKAKDTGVFLTVLGFGRGNLNDEMMEKIADRGNGNYHYVDGQKEARKVLVEEMSGTLVTIAKDVKIQVEFNPAQVAGYRLIGYENRVLAAEDFNDDKKDAGEIGAGHTVTALYEIVPAGKQVDVTKVDDLKYGEPASAERAPIESSTTPSSDLLTLKIRYKQPDGDKSTKLEFPITDNGQSFAKASDDFKFASSVASFGMLLRGSEFKGNATYAAVKEIAEAAARAYDPHGYRQEFVEMVQRARELAGE